MKQDQKVNELYQTKRREDAHRKIKLGGLFVKAGLDNYQDENNALLLGILVEAAKNLQGDKAQEFAAHYTALGDEAFANDN